MTEGIKSLAVEKPPSGVCAYRHIHLNGLHCDILSSYVELNERALICMTSQTIQIFTNSFLFVVFGFVIFKKVAGYKMLTA